MFPTSIYSKMDCTVLQDLVLSRSLGREHFTVTDQTVPTVCATYMIQIPGVLPSTAPGESPQQRWKYLSAGGRDGTREAKSHPTVLSRGQTEAAPERGYAPRALSHQHRGCAWRHRTGHQSRRGKEQAWQGQQPGDGFAPSHRAASPDSREEMGWPGREHSCAEATAADQRNHREAPGAPR